METLGGASVEQNKESSCCWSRPTVRMYVDSSLPGVEPPLTNDELAAWHILASLASPLRKAPLPK
eukprot:scaffold228061_cov34-Tisochrysis_lutea.AAC.3